MTTNSDPEITVPGPASVQELSMRLRWCRGCRFYRRISLARTAALILLVGIVYFCSLQLFQAPASSVEVVERKVVVPTGTSSSPSQQKLPLPGVSVSVPVSVRANKSEIKKGQDAAELNRVIGNGRSPKQVDEVARSRHGEAKDLNQTQRSISVPEAIIPPLPSLPGPTSLELLQDILFKVNKKQTVHNQDKFPPLGPDGLVLIVQVHKREKYLKLLLESLKVTKGIENVLLVISHDYYYDDMNELIRSIDFCQVIQIFYPFSLQVLPTSFPGSSPNDCPRDATKESAMKLNCTNALHPDNYGHYREAIVTAIKHHWWWKVNMVFDNLRATQNYNGYVFFLEEDHYVAPDFIQVARQLIRLKELKCADCDFINLGMYNKVKALNNRVSIGVWNAGKNNMGFGMNREKWNLIRNCSQHFCTYDDYNWDWSLNQLGTACSLLKRNLKVLVLRTPRVFHIGTCGTHHHKSCNEMQQANLVRDLLTRQASSLFPSQLGLDGGTYPAASKKKLKAYGGWGDIRDHQLCLKFTQKRLLELKHPT